MQLAMNGRDVYLRHTGTDGKVHVSQHRTWDAELFVAAQQRAAEKLNAEAIAKGEPSKARVDQITDDQFKKERK